MFTFENRSPRNAHQIILFDVADVECDYKDNFMIEVVFTK